MLTYLRKIIVKNQRRTLKLKINKILFPLREFVVQGKKGTMPHLRPPGLLRF
ncbi:protein of unknown function [Legionella micdadei]|uniref:Uncharacterized protein n=1 Tax=Legionella micdadei TaxID=451 RepID=A0A098GBY3_LEGMI|nr:protein of unknown function [Legionella micdadei]